MPNNIDLGKLFLTQKSLTEWLHDISHEDTTDIRNEDNDKTERLKVLNEIINLPYDISVQFSARDIADNTQAHQEYLENHGEELCALRLIPLDASLPKLRMRGRSVRDVQQWFKDQKIDPDKYRADYKPHVNEQTWSTIFVVTDQGIFGEIIRGRHYQLTQGTHEDGHEPRTFSFDFDSWKMVPADDAALQAIQYVVSFLRTSTEQQSDLAKRLDATFASDYLKGYFETTQSEEFGLWFIDYAPKLGERFTDVTTPRQQNNTGLVSGQVASKGRADGPVAVISPDVSISLEDFPNKAILVCKMTTPDLVPYMQKAGAVVTDQGGILSHAAIVARELHIPCVVGTKNATKLLQNGMNVVVDAEKGVVYPSDINE